MTGLIAYTDGACIGNPGPGGWGVRLLYPDGFVRELGGAVESTTNNRMELQGALEALKVIGPSVEATICTDSRYVIDGLTKWIHRWRHRGWRTTADTPVKNRQLWMALDQVNHPGIRWQHVRGHSGDPENERVDTIARLFALGQSPQLFCGQRGSLVDPVMGAPATGASGAAVATPHQPASSPPATRYVSIVQGEVALDHDWASCAARVRGVSGARYKKVHSPEELAVFCAQYGVVPPPDFWEYC
jgi:ribonuclease HI